MISIRLRPCCSMSNPCSRIFARRLPELKINSMKLVSRTRKCRYSPADADGYRSAHDHRFIGEILETFGNGRERRSSFHCFDGASIKSLIRRLQNLRLRQLTRPIEGKANGDFMG